MSSKYVAARDAFGRGEIAWRDGEVKAQLVSAAYTFDENDQSVGVIGAAAVGAPLDIRGAKLEDGWAKADPLVFDKLIGDPVVAIVFHSAGGLLIEYHDDIDFPADLDRFIPNGGEFTVTIKEPGIFRL